MPTHIDQGVRFEVDAEDWEPFLFITPSTEVPSNSLVRPLSNDRVEADAMRYTSSLPLLVIDPTEPVVVRRFLCRQFVSRLKDNRPLRLRWMQRYRTNPVAGIATWSLDDISIRWLLEEIIIWRLQHWIAPEQYSWGWVLNLFWPFQGTRWGKVSFEFHKNAGNSALSYSTLHL